jgi:tetratricopeptide (TPR) repeat protein
VLDGALLAIAHGRPEEALSLVTGRADADVAAAIVLARIDQRVGRDVEAAVRLARVVSQDAAGESALELGLLLRRTGRRDDAEALLEPLLEVPDGESRPVAALVRAARAAQALSRSRIANGFFREAASQSPGSAVIEAAWGDLFLERHNEAEAVQSFRRALEADPRYVPAMIGLARALTDRNPPAAEEQARAALAIDAGATDAHLVLGELALDERNPTEARTRIDAALAVNPRLARGLALRAAVAAVEGRQAEFEASVAAVLGIDPHDASAYRVPSEHVAGHYRFEEAVRLGRKAVEVDPKDAAARAALGLHLMRTGDEEAAREHLEAAFEGDPFDVVTFNLLALLDTLRSFETVRDGDFVFRLPPEEAPVMRELVPALAREAVTAMSRRYGFTPTGPLLIEMFSKHDDFAVRTAGLPGMIGALGACFGRVVTLDSPRARPPGAFHWGATLWHELAHVFTLQMSNQRVPRWLTEGTSVYEERRARPQWGRESEFDFVRAAADGQAIPLAELNAAFSDPRRIALAYQQASYVVESIVERYGEEALHRLLRAYGEGQDDTSALASALKVERPQLQAEFDGYIDRRYGAMARAMKVPDGIEVDGADSSQLATLADAHAGSYPLQMLAAEALAAAGRPDAAVRYLERAAALVPVAAGAKGPRARLARLALDAGDKARAMAEFEAAVAGDLTSLDEARELAALAAELGDARRAVLAHARISELVPYEWASHSALGRAAFAQGDLAVAAQRFSLALAAGPDDPAGTKTDHAEVLVASGERDAAKRELLSALEQAPLFERAQELLLKVVEPARSGGRQP